MDPKSVLEYAAKNGAKILAERLRAAASNLEWTIGERKLHITLSLGVTTLPFPEEQPENAARIDPRAFHDHLYTVVDNAMYSAKTAGGDRFIFQAPAPLS